MDAYPENYVNHNLPLVLLSGLQADLKDESEISSDYPLLSEKGTHIFSDFPPLSGAVAEELRSLLLEEDSSQTPWRSRVSMSGNVTTANIGYRIKSSGRVG
jgi:hypothetical protein